MQRRAAAPLRPGTCCHDEDPMHGAEPQISVIIPAYNEGRRIAPTVRDIVAFLGNNGYAYEVIVVDDGSTDSTYDVVRHIQREVPQLALVRHPVNLGKGCAVKSGFLAARGEFVFFTDADHSTPIEELPKFMARAHEGCDIVIASRALSDSIIVIPQDWHRRQMGCVFNWLVRAFVIGGIHDTQCGFKCFRRERCAGIFTVQRLRGFSFDVELLFIARTLGLTIAELPVTWRNSAETRVHTLKDSLRMFRDLCRIRWNSVRGKYRVARA
jgi:dolichyl-phosphate beta-glucosyltransferase